MKLLLASSLTALTCLVACGADEPVDVTGSRAGEGAVVLSCVAVDEGADDAACTSQCNADAASCPIELCVCVEISDDDATSDSDDGEAGAHTVTICHRPPGHPSNAHTIEVGEPAARAHLAHGDTLGSCEGDGDTTGSDDEEGPEHDGGNAYDPSVDASPPGTEPMFGDY